MSFLRFLGRRRLFPQHRHRPDVKGVRLSLLELGNGTAPIWLGDVPGVSYTCIGATHKWQYPNAVRRLARYLNSENVDILHTHLFFSGLIGVLAKRLHRTTIVALMRHHTSVVRMLGSRFHVAADKWMAEQADHVITVSEAARAFMTEVDGIGRNDIDIVYLGFDFEKLSPNTDDRLRLRREFGIADDEFVIGYVANFARGKGHIQLMGAFERISAEIPNARLFFAGKAMLPEVEAAAVKFPADKIIFAGWRSDISACLNAMDIFVQPSLSEAFSQVLIEALGVGLPVIATDVGGASEVIESGVNGILIEPNDRSAITDEVVRLYRDEPLRIKLAGAGTDSVRERFTADKMVERHYELYERWISEK